MKKRFRQCSLMSYLVSAFRLRDFLVRSLDQYQKFDNTKKELRLGEEEEIEESQVGASL